MEFKSTRIVGSEDERRLITGLIVCDKFCHEVLPLIELENLKLDYSKPVVRMVQTYYEKYDAAPKEHIEKVFRERQKTMDKGTAGNVENFLDKLSGIHETTRFDSQYEIDKAKRYITKCGLENIAKHLNRLIELDKIDEALDYYNGVDMDMVYKSEVGECWRFLDESEIKSFFADESNKNIFQLEGAVGQLIGPMQRNNLVAVTGPEKRGKCNHYNDLTTLSDGRLRTIGEICQNKDFTNVVSLNESTGKFVEGKILGHCDNGVKKVYKVETRTGRFVRVTKNHPLLTIFGWKELKELKVGDYIAAPREVSFFGKTHWEKGKATILAYLITEGGLTQNIINFTKNDKRAVKILEYFVKQHFGDSIARQKGSNNYYVGGADRGNKTKEWLNSLGLMGKKSSDKYIPDEVFTLDKENLKEFLSVLFDCDGSIEASGTVSYSSASEKIIRQVYHLLLRFGIVGKIKPKIVKDIKYFEITIRDKTNSIKFIERIGFGIEKQEKALRILEKLKNKKMEKSYLDVIPYEFVSTILKKEIDKYTFTKNGSNCPVKGDLLDSYRSAINLKGGITRKRAIKIAHLLGNQEIISVIDNDVIWDKIESIEFVGKEQTYDIAIHKHHNFISNDVVVHNTWWLQHFAFQALEQNLKVVWFSFEMNKTQTKQRIFSYLTGLPSDEDSEVWYPVMDCIDNQLNRCNLKERENKINRPVTEHGEDGKPKPIDFEKYEDYIPCTECRKDKGFKPAIWMFKTNKRKLNQDDMMKKRQLKHLRKMDENCRIHNFPSFSAGANEMRKIIKALEANEGFIPDVIVCDYVDIQHRENFRTSERDAINKLWQNAKRLASELDLIYITADQADAKARDQKSLKKGNFSESKQKDAVLDLRIGLNIDENSNEVENGVMRINVLYRRMGKAVTSKEVMVLQSLELGQTYLDSEFL